MEQLVQVDELREEANVPAEQDVQVDAPALEYLPNPHEVQVILLVPTEYFPASHAAHEVEPNEGWA